MVAQLVEALHYEPEGCGINSLWCPWNFSLTLSFWPHYGPGVDSSSDRNEYQEYFLGGKGGRCIGLTILSCRLCGSGIYFNGNLLLRFYYYRHQVMMMMMMMRRRRRKRWVTMRTIVQVQ